ncbi:MAG TPA: murein biosynthesis integral membrane protein MurJ [Candidatus Eremiobacteraceae bacterium]|nr:murein biosynthesis integral membrane protein MurJ [Candidatus Eremiobacteraceae bacterium]
MTEKTQILKSASIISLVTIVSRVFGYVRDQRISFLLGTTLSADAFVLAYRLPNLFRRLVAEGTVTASFIPIITGYMRAANSEELWKFANRLFWTLAVVLAVVTVLGVVFSPVVIQSFSSPQDRANSWEEAIALNRIIFPYLFFAGLAALGMGILNSFHHFALPAATTALQNLAIIIFSIGLVWHYFQSPAISLAVGVLVGGALQFLILVPQLVARGMRFDFGISFSHPGVKRFAQVVFPRFFGMGVAQINFFVDTFFVTAPRMPRGSLAALYVSDRVMELILGGYAIAVATAILPMMSHQAAANDYEGLKRTLTFAVRIVAYITIPAAVGLMILREPIIRMLFQHGQFVAESTRLTARPLLYYAAGLPALACVKLIVPAFYSASDTKTPVVVGVISFVLNIMFNILFLNSFLYRRFQNGGPALATVLATFFDFFTLFFIFRIRYGTLGTIHIFRSIAKISLCAALMGIGCMVGNHYANYTVQSAFFTQLMVFIALIGGATLLYIGLTWVFRCPEIEEVYGIATRRETAEEWAGS